MCDGDVNEKCEFFLFKKLFERKILEKEEDL